uniref:Cyclin N-terminal domain-containing protein 1 n=1 Tax=Cacopsylla melanoneura TaxID=428564 RepID=A0A8D9ERB1_9HEMI
MLFCTPTPLSYPGAVILMAFFLDTPEPKVRPPSGQVSRFYILGDWDTLYLNDNIGTWLEEARNARSSFYHKLTHNSVALPFLAVFTNVVETVFRIGDDLDLHKDVQFLTIDVFDRYCMKQFDTYCGKMIDLTTEGSKFAFFKSKIADQYLIRLLSCMQLASKYLYTTTEVITSSTVKEWLDKARVEGSNTPVYTIDDIRKSEIRVLSDLNFEVGRGGNNVLFFVECLVYIAVQEDQVQPDILYRTVLQVQAVAYLKRQEIYHKLYNVMTNTWERDVQERINSLPIECDSLLLAAGIVLASVFITTKYIPLMKGLANDLARYIGVPSIDISHLCKILVQLILTE